MVTKKPKHILIAPLDWGLGHTARCVPLISHIISLGHIPVVACNASQRSFIEETFGYIDIIHLEGYDISYSYWNRFAQAGLVSQLPSVLKAIKAEHNWLLKVAMEWSLDGIISDNRYGLHHPHIPSVIMTHQLQVQTGLGSIPDSMVQRLHYRYLDRFGEKWIVDVPGIPNLGGRLSHPSVLPAGARYLGLLSRFAHDPAAIQVKNEATGTLFIMLSGPEPQRSRLSRLLWRQVLDYKGDVVFVEGSDKATPPPYIPPHIAYYSRLTGKTIEPLLRNAEMVICRSGYSTIMDLAATGKKAIFIPTPGQTEQEYLARYLHKEGYFLKAAQRSFDLEASMLRARGCSFRSFRAGDSFTIYQAVLEDWIARL